MNKKTFLIGTFGTRGDIFPLISIAKKIREKGHIIKFITHKEYREMCNELGFLFYCLDEIPFIEKINSKNREDILKLITSLDEHFNKSVGDVDCIISSGLFFQYSSIADKYNKKYIQVVYNTQNFSSCMYVPPIIKSQCTIPAINKILWILYKNTIELLQVKYINLIRNDLGLNRIKNIERYLAEKSILVNDPALCTLPSDFLYKIPYVGYLYNSSTEDECNIENIDNRVKHKKYVYIGFGSMGKYIDDLNNLYNMVEVFRKHNYGIVLCIYGVNCKRDEKNLLKIIQEKDVVIVKRINHEVLFPKMSIIIHHGGIGTTYTACKAGVPQIIFPFYFDQFYWGRRIHELGIGECFSEYSKFNNYKFDKLIEKFSNGDYDHAAKILKSKLNDSKRKHEMDECFDEIIYN